MAYRGVLERPDARKRVDLGLATREDCVALRKHAPIKKTKGFAVQPTRGYVGKLPPQWHILTVGV